MPKPSRVVLEHAASFTPSQNPLRRSFIAADEIRVVREAELCVEPGALGELSRREGIDRSHLSKWRALLREHGEPFLDMAITVAATALRVSRMPFEIFDSLGEAMRRLSLHARSTP